MRSQKALRIKNLENILHAGRVSEDLLFLLCIADFIVKPNCLRNYGLLDIGEKAL